MPSYVSDDEDPELQAAIIESKRMAETHPTGHNRTSASSGPSTVVASSPPAQRSDPGSRIREMQRQLAKIDSEVKRLDEDIAELQRLRHEQAQHRADIQQQLDNLTAGQSSKRNGRVSTDYFQPTEWTIEIKRQLKSVFDIDTFRLAQEGVCNANMDQRDIVCVMPTGGGKSLTYQLPAILQDGCTLVISPLIALITDQILHLREKNIEAEMITGATSKAAKNEITQRLISLSTNNRGPKPDLKLLYVTPERISKSKAFFSSLTRLAEAGKLARIIIDEAHCVSQLGHDFRPDYKQLSILRTHFPDVPILALSATCPPAVLTDILQILQLKPTTPGNGANASGTVLFTSPLYRKNLMYKVKEKSSQAQRVIQDMVDYILKNHPDESGIIYCVRKAETETVAERIREVSGGQITTGVYHSEIADQEKEQLHSRWRMGKIRVVCATIAFGMGIDKADVRFVIHHSMSKSVENYYQESGRAGRDGKDADCVLFYRPQDAFGYADFIRDQTGIDKIEHMLRFCQDVQGCRKIAFAKYFSETKSVAMSAWTEDGSDAIERCGHCDNCTRDPETLEERDETDNAWRCVQIADTALRAKVHVTLANLVATLRGTGTKERDHNLTAVSGTSSISAKDAESLLVRLLLEKRLRQKYQANAYSTNAYLVPGPYALPILKLRLPSTNWPAQDKLTHVFLRPAPKKKARQSAGSKRKRKADVDEDDDDGDGAGEVGESEDVPLARAKPQSKPRSSKPRPKRRKKSTTPEDGGGDTEEDEEHLGNGFETGLVEQLNGVFGSDPVEPDETGDDGEWSTSLRKEPQSRRVKSQPDGGDKTRGKGKEKEKQEEKASERQKVSNLKAAASKTGVRSMEIGTNEFELTDSE